MSIFLEGGTDDSLLNEINMTPLIDVMLVLLIIFIVTLPVMNHAMKVELPKVAAASDATHDENIDVSVDSAGTVLWNKVPVDDGELDRRIAQAAAAATPPTVRIYADRRVVYDRVAHVLSAVQAGGLSKLEFVTEPKATAAGG